MVHINEGGYLERRTVKGKNRDWWLVKYGGTNSGYISLYTTCLSISFPNRFVGKKIRFKVEIMEDKNG